MELICEKAVATSYIQLTPSDALRRILGLISSGILLPGKYPAVWLLGYGGKSLIVEYFFSLWRWAWTTWSMWKRPCRCFIRYDERPSGASYPHCTGWNIPWFDQRCKVKLSSDPISSLFLASVSAASFRPDLQVSPNGPYFSRRSVFLKCAKPEIYWTRSFQRVLKLCLWLSRDVSELRGWKAGGACTQEV